MANEAVIVENPKINRQFTAVDGVNISKGTLCAIQDPKTAVLSANKGEFFAGIAAADKESGDGATEIALAVDGIFDLAVVDGNAAISAGEMVVLSGANTITLADNDAAENYGMVVGMALEDAATDTSETIQVDIGRR